MSKIIKVIPQDDYTLRIEFEHGHKILFNMQRLIKTFPYLALNDLECFRKVVIEDKALYWPNTGDREHTILPARLTVDNILFTIRD
ncbi:DUF2442 domain-containing protein [Desulfosporosinus sp. PR]|uniref:DUF2442 domain-containing protein n=1 Tax=Candidatus Desulfosporosinus nitrosoreducens TaxID=3401928 RepID=UPI0027E8B01D|nr:DUF2442 domain-containing protein [Desulfosporosinus sp. PR]MDQ7096716.1 DUF2442 domain-containing protein [Desulfosporosinus sp. PR]